MLLMPEKFNQAVYTYTASTPDMRAEGTNGYMEVEVTFMVKDLEKFTDVWYASYKLPSDRNKWYHKVKAETLANV